MRTQQILAPTILFLLTSCGEQVVVRETQGNCGNGQIETGEACDDGNEVNTDACTNGCDVAVCGDSVTRDALAPGDADYEACDDGNDLWWTTPAAPPAS